MSFMRCLLRLGIVLALFAVGWFFWRGRVEPVEQSAFGMPVFFQSVLREGQNLLRGVRDTEQDIRHRVQKVQSGAMMIRNGKALIEEGVGRK